LLGKQRNRVTDASIQVNEVGLKKTEVIPRSGCLEGILPVPFMVSATQIEVFILNNINHKGEFGQCSL